MEPVLSSCKAVRLARYHLVLTKPHWLSPVTILSFYVPKNGKICSITLPALASLYFPGSSQDNSSISWWWTQHFWVFHSWGISLTSTTFKVEKGLNYYELIKSLGVLAWSQSTVFDLCMSCLPVLWVMLHSHRLCCCAQGSLQAEPHSKTEARKHDIWYIDVTAKEIRKCTQSWSRLMDKE